MNPNWLQQRAYLSPNKTGLSFGEESWTFEQLNNESIQIAQKLATLHIQKGMRVAILAPSTSQLVWMIYGCMQAQLEMVFLNNRLTKEELAYQVEDAEVQVILADGKMLEKLPAKSNVVSFETVFKSVPINISMDADWNLRQTLSIMYTSGTTGFPKGVRQTLQNHQSSAMSSVLNLGLHETDVWLCAVPIFHISGFSMLMKSILYGNEIRLYEKFDVQAITDDIVSGRVTHMSVVAVTLGRIMDVLEARGEKAHPNFQIMLAGGGPVPIDYLKRALALNIQVAQTYGMTETSSQTATLASADSLRKLGSAGKPLFFNQIRIDGATEPLQEGEILIKGPHVTPGYIGRFANRDSVEEGWLRSGDIGYLDEEGFLYVVDRRSDLIISGGENIYPAQIENALLAHPQVAEAGVCGIADDVWGQVPTAFVIVKGQVTEQELMSFCETQLARYKVPKKIYFVEQLPRNGSNKLMRRKLVELL